ncbi:hypothetical protein QVD17_30554 [Tagetes erecta]|uniref:Uncharacterized protein n=1 Tax=Tagetes erecta TaxID=13708 RepID=A0AAD8NG35_TARER|nr:hypothetical protein QVD17_30554 [Tagetes erecta]
MCETAQAIRLKKYISFDALLVMIVVHDRVTMQSIQCDEPHRELLCCGIYRPEVSHEVSSELQGAAKDSQSAINAVEKSTDEKSEKNCSSIITG